MRTDSVIKAEAFNLLFGKMDAVEAERFIVLLKRDNFDYTRWRTGLWEDRSITEISKSAMEYVERRKE